MHGQNLRKGIVDSFDHLRSSGNPDFNLSFEKMGQQNDNILLEKNSL